MLLPARCMSHLGRQCSQPLPGQSAGSAHRAAPNFLRVTRSQNRLHFLKQAHCLTATLLLAAPTLPSIKQSSTLQLFRNQLQAACPTDTTPAQGWLSQTDQDKFLSFLKCRSLKRGDASRTQNTVPEHIDFAVLPWRACFLWRQVRRVSERMLLRRRRSAATAKIA